MTLRLTQIDEGNIGDHARLTSADRCYFLYEYTSGRNYAFSATNSLINNLKKKPTSPANQLRYKTQAIGRCATDFRNAILGEWLATATIVPVPCSKVATDPEFDDRMTRVAQLITPGLDVRALVRQTASLRASHEVGDGERVSVDELLAVYEIDETLAQPPPAVIGILDDVLTAGTHYRAMHTVLIARFPAAQIYGFFVARRVFPE